jgi:hypothetical protein
MAKGDHVRVGHGSTVHGIAPDNVPVYELEKDEWGNVRSDINGCAFPRPVGGVKGGSAATIAGDPIKVQRGYVERMSESTKSFGGADFVMLFPVYFPHYQKTAYIQANHMHLTHGQLT